MISRISDIPEALTFDDVLLQPAASDFLPSNADITTSLSEKIKLGIPLISAAMDTVTEGRLAISMAQHGGIGCIHKNLSIESQAAEVRKVKKFESGMVVDPITIASDAPLSQALELMSTQRISGIPVNDKHGKLVGIITHRDVRFAENLRQPVSELMTRDVVTVSEDVNREEAMRLLHQYRIEKLLVINDAKECIGLITVKDIEKSKAFPNATKDRKGRLRCMAAIGTGADGISRAEALLAEEVDAVVVDTAHGHSKGVLDAISDLRQMAGKDLTIIGGNIATAEAAEALIKAGVDTVKVGIGPGSICTTRIVAGVGVPQLSAVMSVAEVAHKKGVNVIADGGIKYSGDVAKALAGGADAVMIGSLFAGTEESPGDVILYQGRSYKTYRGMGSVGAMARGSADRYFQQDVTEQLKLVPEGVEGRVPYKGSVEGVVHQLIGGVKAAMGYTGNPTITGLQKNAQFVRITGAGLRESHAHDVTITQEAPNYRSG